MNLRKAKLRMGDEKKTASVQIAVEDDINISDTKPDVTEVVFDKGELYIDEIKVGTDYANVKGKFVFSVLYYSAEGEKPLYSMAGAIAVEEHVTMEGVKTGDSVTVQQHLEDLSVMMINSRKISVRALITLHLTSDGIYDVKVPTGIEESGDVQFRTANKRFWEMVVLKRDVCRIREEIEIPKSMPNIVDIVWEETKIGWIDFRPLNDKIAISGELNVFCLYQGENEEGLLQSYENTHPFNTTISCQDVREDTIPLIHYNITTCEISVKPDFDGEMRIIAVDLTLDLDIRVYKEEEMNMVTDIYGVSSDINVQKTTVNFQNLLSQNIMKQRIAERIQIENNTDGIMQLLYSKPIVVLDEVKTVEDGIEVSGNVEVDILYISNRDEAPYNSVTGNIPFNFTIDVDNISPDCAYRVEPSVEQIHVVMVDSGEVDVKLVLNFRTISFCNGVETVIDEIEELPLDSEKLNQLPSMAMVIAAEGDNLWDIGKRYYVPVDRIREMNQIAGDELHRGDKVMVVR